MTVDMSEIVPEFDLTNNSQTGQLARDIHNIDPALAVELKALALQKPMNDVIDRGDSAVQQLYRDTTVFITGGCGFIGKQLIAKLFRACKIKKMFVLIRSKKDKTIKQRLKTTLSTPLSFILLKNTCLMILQANYIDPALAVELKALALQKPMNDVIDRGDSAIQQLYRDTTVLITGGCGFIGKQLIEKLLRACKIKKMYVLIRSKKGKSIQQRLEDALSSPVYDNLRKKQPNFAACIVPIEGDVSDLALGLSEADWKLLTKEVNIIFHAAATTRFDESIRQATLTNVRGTRETLRLARECGQLLKFVHVSTAFTHATQERVNQDILEQFYTCPVPPHTMISFAEEVDENRLDAITKDLIDGWPNTYTFTKAIAEELVRTDAKDLQVCIVRPPIVIPSYYEPTPGWLDSSTLAGPSGIYLAIVLAILRVFCVDINTHLAMAPVDIVNNIIIASVWDITERNKNEAKNSIVYIISRKSFLQWRFINNQMATNKKCIVTTKAIWYAFILETKHMNLYVVLAFFLHYIPAFLLDIICTVLGKKPKNISSFVDVYRKIDKLTNVYQYFLKNEWNFHDDNVQAMIKRMSPADQTIFNCNMQTIDLVEYVKIWGVGLRRFIIKDGLKDSAKALKKQYIFAVFNTIFLIVYMYVLWLILSTVINVIANIFY